MLKLPLCAQEVLGKNALSDSNLRIGNYQLSKL